MNDAIADVATIDFGNLPPKYLAIDGIHPNPKGYDFMGAVMANALMDLSTEIIGPSPTPTATPTPTETPTPTPTETPTPTPTP